MSFLPLSVVGVEVSGNVGVGGLFVEGDVFGDMEGPTRGVGVE